MACFCPFKRHRPALRLSTLLPPGSCDRWCDVRSFVPAGGVSASHQVLRMRTVNRKSHVRIMPRSGRRGAIALLTFFLLKNKSENKNKNSTAVVLHCSRSKSSSRQWKGTGNIVSMTAVNLQRGAGRGCLCRRCALQIIVTTKTKQKQQQRRYSGSQCILSA